MSRAEKCSLMMNTLWTVVKENHMRHLQVLGGKLTAEMFTIRIIFVDTPKYKEKVRRLIDDVYCNESFVRLTETKTTITYGLYF